MRKTKQIMMNMLINAGIEPTGVESEDLELAWSLLPEVNSDSPNAFKNYCKSMTGQTS